MPSGTLPHSVRPGAPKYLFSFINLLGDKLEFHQEFHNVVVQRRGWLIAP